MDADVEVKGAWKTPAGAFSRTEVADGQVRDWKDWDGMGCWRWDGKYGEGRRAFVGLNMASAPR